MSDIRLIVSECILVCLTQSVENHVIRRVEDHVQRVCSILKLVTHVISWQGLRQGQDCEARKQSQREVSVFHGIPSSVRETEREIKRGERGGRERRGEGGGRGFGL